MKNGSPATAADRVIARLGTTTQAASSGPCRRSLTWRIFQRRYVDLQQLAHPGGHFQIGGSTCRLDAAVQVDGHVNGEPFPSARGGSPVVFHAAVDEPTRG